MLAAAPELARARLTAGATRQNAKAFFLDAIGCYIYAGDTALHVAAAAHRPQIVQELIALGADVRAKNRRGAEPLHAAGNSQRCLRHLAQADLGGLLTSRHIQR